MSQLVLGRTLIIANPTAHSGRGEAAAIFATRFFSAYHNAASTCEVRLTEGSGDARQMATNASEYDTVVALGGDGIIHEVANGLMALDERVRPRMGIIPIGSGNDFARTIGMSRNDAEKAISELLGGMEHTIDLGRVNNTYFVETLSFGLDAAIALDTSRRRENNTRQHGSGLYVTSGLRLVPQGLKGWSYRAIIDGEVEEGLGIAFAIQNGPTYGGGFRICPDALPNDGVLNLCRNVDKPNVIHSLTLFGLVRFGRHVGSKKMGLREVRHVEIEFTGEDKPLCQVDGEALDAERYVVDVVPQTLRVIVPESCPW